MDRSNYEGRFTLHRSRRIARAPERPIGPGLAWIPMDLKSPKEMAGIQLGTQL